MFSYLYVLSAFYELIEDEDGTLQGRCFVAHLVRGIVHINLHSSHIICASVGFSAVPTAFLDMAHSEDNNAWICGHLVLVS